MKTLLAFFIGIGFALPTQAAYTSCPTGWRKQNLFTHSLLLQMKGIRTVGKCKIEFRVCNPELPEVDDGIAGDVLLQYEGKDYYIPLYIDSKSPQSASNLRSGQREVIYRFLDTNRDSMSGDLEQDRFTMRLNYDRTKMVEITLNRKTDYVFSKFIWWKLPKRLSCIEEEK